MVLRACEQLIVGKGHASNSILVSDQLCQVLGFLDFPDLDRGIIRTREEPSLLDLPISVEPLVSLKAEDPAGVLVFVFFDLARLKVVCANGWVLSSYEEKPTEKMQGSDGFS